MGEIIDFNKDFHKRDSKAPIPLDTEDVPLWCLQVIADLVAICESKDLGSTRSHLLELVHKIRLEGGFDGMAPVQHFARGSHES